MPTMKRISCPGFAIIRDPHGRYGLVENMEMKNGELMPVGGALHADAYGLMRLIDYFGAPSKSFENGFALRFVIPVTTKEDIEAVARWFQSRKERDTSVRRVLKHALFEETGVLTRTEAGMLSRVSTFSERPVGFAWGTGQTFRSVPVKDTIYLIQLFRVTFTYTAIMQKLLWWDGQSRSKFRFATADEIRNGRLRRNGIDIPISSIATSLLEFYPRLIED